jgi:phosphatidylserine/phosphatidylglycerophosphate/cardiolipin synthase-like enzyme
MLLCTFPLDTPFGHASVDVINTVDFEGERMRFTFAQAMVMTILGLQMACAPSKSSNDLSQGFSSTPMETCFSPKEACDQKIIAFIDGAQQSLDIAIYAITHPGIADAIQRAHSRGLRVRMVVDRVQAAGNSSLVDELSSSGIPLKIGNTGRAIMHNKFTIVDGRALETGSYNYTRNATSENSENQMYIFESTVLERFQADFESLWSNGLNPTPKPEVAPTQNVPTEGPSVGT